MRIAATYDNGQIFQHFGHTETFKIYDVNDGKITFSSVMATNGSGHGALAGYLSKLRVDTLICGGIGGGAQAALREAGIRICAGVQGEADAAVAELIAGTLEYSESANCSHHHDSDHECGDHGCGSHSCGGHCGDK